MQTITKHKDKHSILLEGLPHHKTNLCNAFDIGVLLCNAVEMDHVVSCVTRSENSYVNISDAIGSQIDFQVSFQPNLFSVVCLCSISLY